MFDRYVRQGDVTHNTTVEAAPPGDAAIAAAIASQAVGVNGE